MTGFPGSHLVLDGFGCSDGCRGDGISGRVKWIVITMPDFIENEANNINQLFEAGLDLLHLRKPESCIDDCERR